MGLIPSELNILEMIKNGIPLGKNFCQKHETEITKYILYILSVLLPLTVKSMQVKLTSKHHICNRNNVCTVQKTSVCNTLQACS